MVKNTEKVDTKSGEDELNKGKETIFSISAVIDSFIYRVLDIEDCAREFIPTAKKKFNENANRLKDELTEYPKAIQIETETGHEKRLVAVRNIRRYIREIDRHTNSNPMGVLEKSLFISLFSSFDKYIGDLIAVLYNRNLDLYKSLNREIPLSEILQYDSIEDLREVVLDKEIESIKRTSYTDQFSDLEKRFSIELKQFDSWPNFIESSQRRNLFTHCDGVVSKQYVDVCKSVNYKFDVTPEIGSQLGIGASYFNDTCRMLSEVSVMLGQTLWRKIKPDDIDLADATLSRLIFYFLHMEAWEKSISISQFALNLPKISNDQMKRIFIVNYAIALKAINKSPEAKKVLDQKDWSATSYDFRLAYSILCEDFKQAGELMKRIGKEGELIEEMSYHDWPLFRDFRDKPEFLENYEIVYGYKYLTKLNLLADEKKTETVVSDEDQETLASKRLTNTEKEEH